MAAAKRDSEATKAAILDAAEKAIIAKGFAEASTSEIAERAGVTKSLIHHHFGSKDGLWDAVKVRRFNIYAERQMEMLQDPPSPDLLKGAAEYYFKFLQENPQLVSILRWIGLEFSQGKTDACHDSAQGLAEAGMAKVREAQAAGFVRADVDPISVVFIMLALSAHWFQDRDHFCTDCGVTKPVEELDEMYLNDMLKIFTEGVLPR